MTLATLNKGDNFTLQLLVDSEDPPRMTVSGRIEDETRPSQNEYIEYQRGYAATAA